MRYNEARKKFEPAWQKYWEKKKVYQAKGKGKKWYSLIEFPYPSGDGLHVGHVRSNTAMDIISRKRRMEGHDVLFPIGWDAFGLPTENYAIKTGISPEEATKKNTDNFRRQLKELGFSFDWSREINTTDPSYYKWTQWLFLQFYKHGLAYKDKSTINWCPKDKIGLANEEAAGGVCDRCGGPVEQREKEQWMLRITKYADKLLTGLKDVDYIPQARTQQENWIGKSEGAKICFPIKTNANFVFLHGFKGSPETDFFPWLKKELESRGGKVFALKLPNPNEPLIDEQVSFAIKNAPLDENTVLITHSLGGVVALKLLSKIKGKIGKVVMVAPPLKTIFLDGKDRPALNKCCDWIFDFKSAQEHAEKIVVIGDTKDDVVPISHPQEIAKELNAELVTVVANAPHFNSDVEMAVLKSANPAIKVFTTRPDTIYGATYMVLAPEHELIQQLKSQISNLKEVGKYVAEAKKKTDIERGGDKIKTGVELKGIKAINPATKQEIPVWVADYVMTGYGTGAIMAVPQHDERDREFAEKYKLPIVDKPLASWDEALKATGGKKTTQYKLRDWVFSRQRYWGEPIPLINCGKCGWVPVPEKELPLKLPKVEKYQPTDTGESPLSKVGKWVNVKCPTCKGPAKRETDTMPNWAGSSWYFLRYTDPTNKKAFADPKKLKYFTPVDWYNGGMEHTVLHLLYSRFWNMFLHDIGLVPTSEPYKKRTSHGLILAEGGVKMSKSKGNVINPDEIIKEFGADSLRLYEMFIGPFDQAVAWDVRGILGTHRFLERVWAIGTESAFSNSRELENSRLDRAINKLIKKVGEDVESMSFNTAVSAMMIFVNEVANSNQQVSQETWEKFLLLLSPFAPHIAEELWNKIGHKKSIQLEPWPTYDKNLIVDAEFELVIQINGKIRDKVSAPMGISQSEAEKLALGREEVKKWVTGTSKKVIYVQNRLINFIV